MTPELDCCRMSAQNVNLGLHLSEEQFAELLGLSGLDGAAHPHADECGDCAGELAAVRESIGLFRDASRAYADRELRHLPAMGLPARRPVSPVQQSARWLAAAALLLSALTPMQIARMRGFHATAQETAAASTATSTESDEALLDDVDSEASASLPRPMQALADPSASLIVSTSNSTQRKD